ATLDSAIITRKNADVSESMMSRIWSAVTTSNELGCPGRSARSNLSAVIAASVATGTGTVRAASTVMKSELVSSYGKLRLAARYGTTPPSVVPGGWKMLAGF